jgi:ATP-dependent RNA helicase DHX57
MAPRRKNESIKKSGTTSSKAEPLPDWVKDKSIAKPPPKYTQSQQLNRAATATSGVASETAPPRPPPLFPPNTKTPISLLNERIQKHYSSQGWLRPNIEARKAPRQEQNGDADSSEGEKWTFVVTLSKTNKADQNNPFTVRFDARDFTGLEGSAVALNSKEEAKHWGATYALFRLCSTLSLYQVLPPGPREYWKKLSTHKSSAPEHLNWLWAADPFEAAQKLSAEKEAKQGARLKREEEGEKGPRISRAWQDAREVRMAKELRDAVEATVRKALQVYPANDAVESMEGDDLEEDTNRYDSVIPSLLKLGFRKGHARSACEWLKKARSGQSTSSASLASITHLSDLDACLEYLTVFCPEEDLPKAFAPSVKADSFVTSSAAAGKEETLAMRWVEDRMVKLAGYPRPAVAKTLASITDLPLQERDGACTDLLLSNLSEVSAEKPVPSSSHGRHSIKADLRLEERLTLEAVLGADRIKSIPTSEKPLSGDTLQAREFYDVVIAEKGEDIRLRICPGARSVYPQEGDAKAIPTFCVVSSTLPAYLRLALTRRLGRCLLGQEARYDDWREIIEAGQGGVLLAMVEELESCWKNITEDPPELAVVMKGVTVQSDASRKTNGNGQQNGNARSAARAMKSFRPPPKLSRDAKEDQHLKETQARLLQSSDYRPMAAVRAALPAMASKSTILSLLEKNRLLIIAGETGCGKTTQCPQFVLDDYIERGEGSLCNIIVTQPRRLSAMGVASRVAAERCEDLDGRGRVGYTIRGERKAGRQTRLLFSTTGVLLRRLSQHDRDLEGVSHIFVDEVHERGVESDLLLLELREVLQRNPNLRVVLMSATIDQETFSRYFDSAPVITIPGRTHPVADFYLEDVRSLIGMQQDDQQERVQGIDYELIGSTAKMICERAADKGDYDGAILIFCPGVAEIRMAMEAIQRTLRGTVEVMPLHANLTPDEQRRVFKKTRAGTRKIIVSTNVAETSITIDDVVYVIDLGLVKENRYDEVTGLTRLLEVKCSKAASRQRRGRAGRVRPGECFKLYTRNTEEFKMEAQQIPEIMRMSLENLILTVKALKGDEVDVSTYLGMAISPPSVAAIEKAVELLAEMNIIQASRLTALGKHVSLLPLDVRLAKMLVLGCIFHCLDPILTAASIMSAKPLFGGPYEKREQVSAARLKFHTGSSDILTDTRAFQQWVTLKKNRASSSEVKRWCEDSFVSPSALRDIASTRSDLLGNLVELGFVPSSYGKTKSSYFDKNASDINLQRSLLLAGLYPSVVRIAHPKARFDQSSSGAIQRESEAKQVRYFDSSNQRVFLHPSSTLFAHNKYQSDFLTYFSKSVSKSNGSESGEKIYLRDANEVPIFAMLLFGGKMKVHRMQGGISMSCSSDQEQGWIKLRASARISTLVQHLRFLLDAALEKSFENPTENVFESGLEAEVRDCLQRVLEKDGLS